MANMSPIALLAFAHFTLWMLDPDLAMWPLRAVSVRTSQVIGGTAVPSKPAQTDSSFANGAVSSSLQNSRVALTSPAFLAGSQLEPKVRSDAWFGSDVGELLSAIASNQAGPRKLRGNVEANDVSQTPHPYQRRNFSRTGFHAQPVRIIGFGRCGQWNARRPNDVSINTAYDLIRPSRRRVSPNRHGRAHELSPATKRMYRPIAHTISRHTLASTSKRRSVY